MLDLSIIIVNYNGEKYLKNCIDSIYKNCLKIKFEIIIIDNNSTDKSLALLDENFPKVKLIKSKVNLGFAKGNNEAVKTSKGKNILLLNNDTILLDDIKPAIEVIKDCDVGAVGIKMLNGNKKYTPSVGIFPNPFSVIKFSLLQNKKKEFLNGDFYTKDRITVDWVCGAFLLTTKDLWESIGGLDEDYFMYVEDVDFCKKINNLNKRIIFMPNISFIHFVGFNKDREIRLIKGYWLYVSKHFNTINSLIAKICLIINYVYKRIFKNIC